MRLPLYAKTTLYNITLNSKKPLVLLLRSRAVWKLKQLIRNLTLIRTNSVIYVQEVHCFKLTENY